MVHLPKNYCVKHTAEMRETLRGTVLTNFLLSECIIPEFHSNFDEASHVTHVSQYLQKYRRIFIHVLSLHDVFFYLHG